MFFTPKPQPRIGIIVVYLLALLLVTGIGLLAFVQLGQISTTVNHLTNNLAVQRALSRNIVSQVLLTRFFALQYVRTQQQIDLDRFNEEMARLDDLLAQAEQQTTNPERVEMLNRIKPAVNRYGATFAEVARLVQQRQKIYTEVMDVKNATMESQLTALRIQTVFLDAPSVFLAFTNAQQALRLLNLDVARYLEAGDERYAVEFEANYRQMQAALLSIGTNLPQPAQRSHLAKIRSALEDYHRGFQDIHTNYVRSKELLNIMLDTLGPEISRTASDITASIDREFQAQNESSQTLIWQTRLVLMAITTIALMAGLGLSVVVSHYISERLRSERELKAYRDHLEELVAERTRDLHESERALATLIRNLPGMAYRCRNDRAWTMEFISEGCLAVTGFPPAAFINNATIAYADLIHPDDRERVWQKVQAAVQARRSFRLTYRITARNGQEKWMWEQGQGVFDNQDRLLALEGFIADITDRIHAEQGLRQAKDIAEEAKRSAEAASHAKSIFLAHMSHELRTPLNAILGFSQLMSHDATLSPTQREHLETINRSGEHLLALINDVLELSKIEAGRLSLQEETFDLHHLLGGVESMFRLRAVKKGILLTLEQSPGVPQYIRADQGKLRQILINLLGNAVKFTPQGSVTLKVEAQQPNTEAGSQAQPPSSIWLNFEVADTGIGITPNEITTIFNAFVQTEAGRKSQEGTGLGLTICRQFVQLMGGDISVTSDGVPGKGTVFKFSVPVVPVEPPETEPVKTKSYSRAVGLVPGQPVYRLLVVEDVPASRRVLVKLLQTIGSVLPAAAAGPESGFEVREAANGREAVDIWAEWQPHLIWMDIRMPVMDGLEATRRIKSQPQGQSTAIIALTASAFQEDREQFVAAGCDDFVGKPFREEEIAYMLAQHLGVRFVYDRPVAGQPAKPLPGGPETALDFAGLPADWRAELRRAVIEVNPEKITALVAGIRGQHPDLAAALLERVSNFEYEAILTALNRPDPPEARVETPAGLEGGLAP